MARPIEYNQTLQSKAEEYVMNTQIPFIEELALELNINDDTINEWSKKLDKKTKELAFPEFSATIKRLKMKQKVALLKASLGKQFNVTGAIFQLKANHGMIETSRVENTNLNADIVNTKNMTDEELDKEIKRLEKAIQT